MICRIDRTLTNSYGHLGQPYVHRSSLLVYNTLRYISLNYRITLVIVPRRCMELDGQHEVLDSMRQQQNKKLLVRHCLHGRLGLYPALYVTARIVLQKCGMEYGHRSSQTGSKYCCEYVCHGQATLYQRSVAQCIQIPNKQKMIMK